MQKTKRECTQCGQMITGRADKQYCSNQCRAAASNSRKADDAGERLMKEINNKLRHNRQVLQRASPEGKTTLRREVLQLAGFDFRHFTHLYRTKQGTTYHFCYDYGYLLLEDEKVLIVNWQPYMEQK
jgi:predicted nucleic acid-binding Zn ribbon protein